MSIGRKLRRVSIVCGALLVCACVCGVAQQPFDLVAAERAERHSSAEWMMVEPHLPNAKTGSAQDLETAADVLRARRMPEDALEYYGYALDRGGDAARLINRIGVTELELHRADLARAAFRRALILRPKDAESWNNLGAAEYVYGNFQAAILDYQKAIKLNKKAAVFRSNLGTAYFEMKDYESARQEFEKAVKLDSGVFLKGGWAGIQAHILSPKDRGRFCFEMARLAARHHDDEGVLRWLAQASESGFDVKFEMGDDRDFDRYRKDVRVAMMIKNARTMRAGQVASVDPAVSLPSEPKP